MDYYDEIAPRYNSFRKEEQLEKARFVQGLINPKPKDKILDVGCGTGLSMSLFQCDIVGVDNSEQMLKHNPYRTKRADAEDLPFPDYSFDYVISITAAQNFSNVEAAVKEIHRVVKKVAVITILSKSKKLNLLKDSLNRNFSSVKEYKLRIDSAFYCIK